MIKGNFENIEVIRQRPEMATPSANEHIGEMAAVSPLENVCGIESLSPAASASLPPPRQYTGR
jgi:hypothetical protein